MLHTLSPYREEAEGLFACLEFNEATTPGAQGSRPSTPSFVAAASSPGALDDSNFPSLGAEAAPTRVLTLHT